MESKPANLILITVDSLRADHLSCYGYRQPTSPNLDALAGSGWLYTQAFSCGPNTPHAFPGILASHSPLRYARLGLFDAPLTLAEALKMAGYRTLALNAANPYVSRWFHYQRGFDEFYDFLDDLSPAAKPSPTSHADGDSEQSERWPSSVISEPQFDLNRYLISEESIHQKACLETEINARIFDVIDAIRSEPFFLWVHYMDTHYPYLPQREAQEQMDGVFISKTENRRLNQQVRENMALTPEALQATVHLYDAAVRQLDNKIGELLDFLKKGHIFDSTHLIFTADHGEEFLEHGDLQHKSKLFDELLRVPLIVKLAHNQAGERCHDLVSLSQLAPTVLELLGLENRFENDGFLHHAWHAAAQPRQRVFAEASYVHQNHTPVDQNLLNTELLPKMYACRNRHWKLTFDTATKQFALYNLLEDPMETKNLYASHSAKVASMQNVLLARIAELERSRLRAQIARIRNKIAIPNQAEHALRISF